MSVSRIEGDPSGDSYYHVMSRTAGKQMLFGPEEKNVFAKRLRRQARFAGIQVLTWCMMDNHFHILIRVPAKEGLLASLLEDGRRKLWDHLRFLYSREQVRAIRGEIEQMERAKGAGAQARANRLVAQYTRRMGNLSIFMQELKFAFSAWFNRKHGREGTLWMARFKSVLLEGDSAVLTKVAAYVDLNPVRAGLDRSPGGYRWCGYAQALGGDREARKGLSRVYGQSRSDWKQVGPLYRCLLYVEGVEIRGRSGGVKRLGISEEEFHRVTGLRGRQGAARRLCRRVRSFGEGAAVGGREFLEKVFAANRTMFGPKRKKGAKRLRGPNWKDVQLFSLREVGE